MGRGNRRSIGRLCMATAVVMVGVTGILQAPTQAATSGVLIGLFPGDVFQTPVGDPAVTLAQREGSWQGKTNAIVNFYSSWDADSTALLFEKILPDIWSAGSVPMISWAPSAAATPGGDYALIQDGAFDPYLKQWASLMKTFLEGPDKAYESTDTGDDRRVYLRFAWEMNEQSNPWEVGFPAASADLPTACSFLHSREAAFVAMWRHVHDVISATLDSDHLAWVFAPGAGDAPIAQKCGAITPAIYPGDAYVDWMGIDGYERDPSATPDSVFDATISTLQGLSTRPIGITEWGAMTCKIPNQVFQVDYGVSPCPSTANSNIQTKGNWIASFFTWAAASPVKMAVSFDRNADYDWAFFCPAASPTDPYCEGDSSFTAADGTKYDTYSAYATGVASPTFIGSNTGYARLLTHNQFLGL